jgi:uncharacterized protein YerC
MTMVSRYKLDKISNERIHDLFYRTLTSFKNKDQLCDFLQEFFTPTERTMFAKRLAIAILLAKDWNFRSISKFLKVSTRTILSMNYWISHMEANLKKQVMKIIDDEKNEAFWAKIGYGLDLMTMHTKGTNWGENRRRIEQEKRKHEHIV